MLIPGTYRVSVAAEGFRTVVRDNVTLGVGQTLTVDMRLDLGAVSETVQVTAELPVLDLTSIEQGNLIDNKELMDRPVMGNNPTLLTKAAACGATRRCRRMPTSRKTWVLQAGADETHPALRHAERVQPVSVRQSEHRSDEYELRHGAAANSRGEPVPAVPDAHTVLTASTLRGGGTLSFVPQPWSGQALFWRS